MSSHALLHIDGASVEVVVRLNPRARRIVMRINPATGAVTVTAPTRTGLERALAFARGESDWIARQRGAVPPQIALAPGAIVPFSGVAHRVRHSSEKGVGPAWRDEAVREIIVSGKPEHANRRLNDFLKREARRLCEEQAIAMGARLGVRPSRVTVRDTASRWGSCSSARALSFSWRLILAPDFVRDYVVAHEVAHLKEMNHGPRFWAHVQSLDVDCRRAKKWLRENGRSLLRYN